MSSNASQICYTLVHDNAQDQYGAQDLRAALEKGTDEVKLETLRRIIVSTLNGNSQPTLLMPIIQFVLPTRNKQIKKMLHFYWEVCPKYDESGKLKQEMILVCNAIRNDLQHPNEYIRGATLRFVQKLREPELLEPLVPTIRTCLEHRHSFVRKNAVFAVYSIYQAFDYLIPDAPELVQTFLTAESDLTCKRNAFIMLVNTSPVRAIEYLVQIYEQISSMDGLMQQAVIELIRKDREGKGEGGKEELKVIVGGMKVRYIRIISDLLESSSHSVKYEAAMTLTTLTQNPAAVKAAAACFIDLIVKESDNNVKMIVLDRVEALRSKHEHVLDDMVMDLLRVLSSPDMDLRRKATNLALDMVNSRNVEDVVLFFKKELIKTLSETFEKNAEYRQLLIQSIHTCAIKFSEVASNVVHVLMEFLGDSNNSAAVDVISFVREVVEKFPDLRSSIIKKLLQTFGDIKSGKVFRGALWIVGEYCTTEEDMLETLQQIRTVIGEVPILASEQRLLDAAEAEAEAEAQVIEGGNSKPVPTTTTKVLADGTYATETSFSVTASASLSKVKAQSKPPLRALILGGDFYTGSVLASALTKLVLRFVGLSKNSSLINELRAEAMLMMTSVIRVGQSQFVSVPIDEDSVERITTCLQALAEVSQAKSIEEVFLHDTQAAYTQMIAHVEKKAAEKRGKDKKSVAVQPDDLITFRQFTKKNDGYVDDYEADLTQATGNLDTANDFLSKLSRIVQLTGFSDPVYAEAYVNVNQFDIMLDVLIVNQTPETLQNLTVEFATLGDLKLVERPIPHTLGPMSFQSIKATIKVSSTETGVIFGNIFYDGPATSDGHCVVLNDIHIDILDYIKPAFCNENQFRSMWTEFEWENKVNVNTAIDDLRTYLDHIMAATNMSCLTPDAALSGDCGFLSANMYARSLFGEDALANLSIEKADGVLQGHVRIRSKTQGIALSLGDKITLLQSKKASTPVAAS